jgi:hypothetical protein
MIGLEAGIARRFKKRFQRLLLVSPGTGGQCPPLNVRKKNFSAAFWVCYGTRFATFFLVDLLVGLRVNDAF